MVANNPINNKCGALTVDTTANIGTSLTAPTVYGTTFDTNVTAAGLTMSGTTIAADGTDANINVNLNVQGRAALITSGQVRSTYIPAAKWTTGNLIDPALLSFCDDASIGTSSVTLYSRTANGGAEAYSFINVGANNYNGDLHLTCSYDSSMVQAIINSWNQSGTYYPHTTNYSDLGGSSNYWKMLYVTDITCPNAAKMVQQVYTGTSSLATITGVITVDDSKPQKTEGTELLTLAITPKSASNKLVIEFKSFGSTDFTNTVTAALFQDTTTDALAAECTVYTNAVFNKSFVRYTMDAGTTSATTFKIRMGVQSNNLYVNGYSAARYMGGVANTTMTITEYKP
jgi:hypothetical protein